MDRTALDLVAARDSRVEQIWRSLEAQAQPSYFLSWGWIENWLAALPADEMPSLAIVHEQDQPMAAFFLAQRRIRRNLVMQRNALYFNATGSARHDGVSIEHNGLLATPGARRSLASIVDLLPGDWDELFLPAVDRDAFDDLGAPGSRLHRYTVRIEREVAAPCVDLEAVRTVDGGYEALLPPSTRTQLQHARSIAGEVDVEVAVDTRHALAIYDELLRLRARRSAFRSIRVGTDPRCERFHRRLIQTRMPYGEIQLFRIRSGTTTLGCFYNFVYRGRVLFYQCGLPLFDDVQLKTGYLCHAAIVEYNALAGHALYELLGGRVTFAENLATGINRLVWLRVQRPLARLSLEDGVRRWYELLLGDRSLTPRAA